MSPRLELELEGDTFDPGDAVRGTVHVVEGGGSRALHAELRFREHSNGYYSTAHTVTPPEPLHTGDLADGARIDFALGLPADAPPELSGPHGELFWELHVRSDELGPDTHVSRPISVRPRA